MILNEKKSYIFKYEYYFRPPVLHTTEIRSVYLNQISAETLLFTMNSKQIDLKVRRKKGKLFELFFSYQ